MTTFAEDIENAARGETILFACVGETRGCASSDSDRSLGESVHPWVIVRPVLDYEYDSGFGGQDCHDFMAWTETRVFFVYEYDGSTRVDSMPRNPAPFSEHGQ